MCPLKAYFKAVMVFLTVIMGCATFAGTPSTHPLSPIHTYDVYISSSCSPSHYEEIDQAFKEWEFNTHQIVKFYRVEHAVVGRPFIGVWCRNQEQLTKIYPQQSIDGLAMYHGYDTTILLLDTMNPRDFTSVALHEIGHALGLIHPNDPHNDTVMAAYMGQDSDHLTCRDLIAFCERWSCDAHQLPLCQ